jgi:hypothetical protein
VGSLCLALGGDYRICTLRFQSGILFAQTG